MPARYTSQTCSKCGYIDKANRVSQAQFAYKSWGFEKHADLNVVLNILAGGYLAQDCGVFNTSYSMKQDLGN